MTFVSFNTHINRSLCAMDSASQPLSVAFNHELRAHRARTIGIY